EQVANYDCRYTLFNTTLFVYIIAGYFCNFYASSESCSLHGTLSSTVISRLFYSAVSIEALKLNRNVVFNAAIRLLGFNLSLEHVFSAGLWIISTLLLAITLFGHGYAHEAEEIEEILPGIVILYVLEAAILVLSILGVYGARKEKKWAVVLVSLLSQSVSLIPNLFVCLG
uniref:Uncharacterized protein n=1 Tax=Hucho hucho TaxID=62062 RepID=A0A4W5N1I8_9TELE